VASVISGNVTDQQGLVAMVIPKFVVRLASSADLRDDGIYDGLRFEGFTDFFRCRFDSASTLEILGHLSQ
jgi:hypothetical protein